ncbi:hypothetical protein FNV43_RR20831 [Rhamnella rubrinervis]|uniref:Uncharacterized protein n=1 Tax=Rhamnella rubrinervis TaxID=2594499 RepID=A0A8K0E264_9ROSA|nr:hypothetical protein FNV43_RR20831 [Rhamnella rubrinervis]
MLLLFALLASKVKFPLSGSTETISDFKCLKEFTEYGKQKLNTNPNFLVNSSLEGLELGGLAGGLKEFTEYGKQKLNINSNFHVNSSLKGLVLGGLAGEVASPGLHGTLQLLLSLSAVEFLRDHFNGELSRDEVQEVASLSVEKRKSSSFQEVA